MPTTIALHKYHPLNQKNVNTRQTRSAVALSTQSPLMSGFLKAWSRTVCHGDLMKTEFSVPLRKVYSKVAPTTDQFHRFNQFVRDVFHSTEHKHSIMNILDYSKAYDWVWHTYLLLGVLSASSNCWWHS